MAAKNTLKAGDLVSCTRRQHACYKQVGRIRSINPERPAVGWGEGAYWPESATVWFDEAGEDYFSINTEYLKKVPEGTPLTKGAQAARMEALGRAIANIGKK